MSPFRAARSSSDTAVSCTSAPPPFLAFFTAVRSAERWARLRTAAARDFRRSFFADLIFGTQNLEAELETKQTGLTAVAEALQPPPHDMVHDRLIKVFRSWGWVKARGTGGLPQPSRQATRRLLTPLVRRATFQLRFAWNHQSPPAELDALQQLALVAPSLLFAMVAHEYAHGYAALRQGDTTAYALGRLTWNPVKHIDPFMTVLLPLLLALMGGPIFGGAKPVPVNPRNYRNYKRGDIIVSLAGVTANVAIAIASVPLVILVGLLGAYLPAAERPLAILQIMLEQGIFINLMLAAFNLMPIPPLDGSHVFKYLLPPQWALGYQRLGSVGMLLLFALLSFGRPLVNAWLAPAYALRLLAERVYYPYMLSNPFAA